MIIDGHIDVFYSIPIQKRVFSEESERGHVDLPRLKKGNVLAAFFAVFPANSDYYLYMGVDNWFKFVENKQNELLQIVTVDDLELCRKEKKIGAILHFEGSGGIDSEFHNLRNYYRLGLRSMGLSWFDMF